MGRSGLALQKRRYWQHAREPTAAVHSVYDVPLVLVWSQWPSCGMAVTIAEVACSHNVCRTIGTSLRFRVQVLGSTAQQDGLSFGQTKAGNQLGGILLPHGQVAVIAVIALPTSGLTPKRGETIRHDGLQG